MAGPLCVVAEGISSIFLTLLCHRAGSREEEDVALVTVDQAGQIRARARATTRAIHLNYFRPAHSGYNGPITNSSSQGLPIHTAPASVGPRPVNWAPSPVHQLFCQLCAQGGHVAFCPSLPNASSIPQAHAAYGADMPNQTLGWYIDLEATHHVAVDFSNISIHEDQ